MSTPTTAQLRAWAREQGMDVGDRGRLSPEVRAAWDAAHGGSDAAASGAPATGAAAAKAAPRAGRPRKVAAATSGSRTTATTARPAKKAAPTRAAAPAKSAPAQRSEEPAVTPTAVPQQGREPSGTAQDTEPRDDPRVDDLERKVSELARRVAQLERAAATPAPARRVFRRRG